MTPETLVNKSLYKAKKSPKFEELLWIKSMILAKFGYLLTKIFFPQN